MFGQLEVSSSKVQDTPTLKKMYMCHQCTDMSCILGHTIADLLCRETKLLHPVSCTHIQDLRQSVHRSHCRGHHKFLLAQEAPCMMSTFRHSKSQSPRRMRYSMAVLNLHRPYHHNYHHVHCTVLAAERHTHRMR